MKYFFTLGNNPTLSVAELSAVFGAENGELIDKGVFFLETEKVINYEELIKKIGGTIKIGEIMESVSVDDEGLDLRLTEIIAQAHNKKQNKTKFGISYYGTKGFDVKKIAMDIKNNLKENEISASWVSGRRIGEPISSVVVERNRLIKKGIDFVLIKDEDKLLIGKTLVVQPFKDLSFRDYNRPARDDRSGMIPPKLAQIMLNLAMSIETRNVMSLGKDKNPLNPPFLKGADIGNKVIYDPFCGSGTILTEAVLMGCQTIIGSDVSGKAVSDAQKNIKWIVNKYKLEKINANIFQYDSQKVSQYLKKPFVDAIVTEPYLGPQRGKFDVERVVRELNRLYSASLIEFEKILKPEGRIVMIWPIFRVNDKLFKINPELGNFKIINPISNYLSKNKNIKLTDRKTIIYGRPSQRVWREIVVLEAII